MTVTQLSPPIPMMCPKGEGMAWFLIDYSPEHDLLWTIAINDTGEIWTYANKYVKAIKNITLDRLTKDSRNKKSFLCPFCKVSKEILITNADDRLFSNITEPCRTCNWKGFVYE